MRVHSPSFPDLVELHLRLHKRRMDPVDQLAARALDSIGAAARIGDLI